MLFALKRSWQGGLLGLLILVPLGVILRASLDDAPPVMVSWTNFGWGVVVFLVVLASDLLLHLALKLFLGTVYLERYAELVGLFREQTWLGLMMGALLAGLGEELVFRGLSPRWEFLTAAALVFGLLHHVRRTLWPFTLWAAYQGLLLALALHLTGCLFVTMVAHFLHDCCGFLVFRWWNQSVPGRT